MVFAINSYIEKSKKCIKGIPRLKKEIQELSNIVKQGNRDRNIIKKLQLKTVILRHYIGVLDSLGVTGNILIDIYFNAKDNRIIANKYDLSSDTIQRYKYFSEKYHSDWERLAILLYGIDALILTTKGS